MASMNPQALLHQAQEYYKAERWQDALNILDELTVGGALKPEDIMHMRAMCMARLGKEESAEMLCDLLEVLHHDPRGQKLKPHIHDARREEKKAPVIKEPFKLPGFVLPTLAILIIGGAVVGGGGYVAFKAMTAVPEPVDYAPAPVAERILNFPESFSLGTVSIRPWTLDSSTFLDGDILWTPLGPAQGAVTIPAGQEVALKLRSDIPLDLSVLQSFPADALYFFDAGGTILGDKDLDFIKHMIGLRDIDITSTGITGAGLLKLHRITSLRRLSFDNLECGEEGWAYIMSLPLLREFTADQTDITDARLVAICKNSPKLSFISLDYNSQITDEGVRHIAELELLQQLFLSYSRITDEGMAFLQKSSTLERLWLEGTAVTDTGVEALKNMPSIQRVGLAKTRVTDAGLEHLKQIRALTVLDIAQCRQLTPSGIEGLRAALPNCEVQTAGGTSGFAPMW